MTETGDSSIIKITATVDVKTNEAESNLNKVSDKVSSLDKLLKSLERVNVSLNFDAKPLTDAMVKLTQMADQIKSLENKQIKFGFDTTGINQASYAFKGLETVGTQAGQAISNSFKQAGESAVKSATESVEKIKKVHKDGANQIAAEAEKAANKTKALETFKIVEQINQATALEIDAIRKGANEKAAAYAQSRNSLLASLVDYNNREFLEIKQATKAETAEKKLGIENVTKMRNVAAQQQLADIKAQTNNLIAEEKASQVLRLDSYKKLLELEKVALKNKLNDDSALLRQQADAEKQIYRDKQQSLIDQINKTKAALSANMDMSKSLGLGSSITAISNEITRLNGFIKQEESKLNSDLKADRENSHKEAIAALQNKASKEIEIARATKKTISEIQSAPFNVSALGSLSQQHVTTASPMTQAMGNSRQTSNTSMTDRMSISDVYNRSQVLPTANSTQTQLQDLRNSLKQAEQLHLTSHTEQLAQYKSFLQLRNVADRKGNEERKAHYQSEADVIKATQISSYNHVISLINSQRTHLEQLRAAQTSDIAVRQINREIEALERRNNVANRQVSSFTVAQTRGDTGLRQNELGGQTSTVNGLTGALNKLQQTLMMVGVALSGRQIMEYADQWLHFVNAVGIATEKTGNAAVMQEKMFNLAQDTRAPLDAVTGVYLRMSRAAETLNITQGETVKTIDTVIKALAIMGTSPNQVRGGLLQLEQALGGVVVRGQEFKSIQDSMPALMSVVVKHYDEAKKAIDLENAAMRGASQTELELIKGKKQTIFTLADLRKEMYAGRLESVVMQRAMVLGNEEISATFDKTHKTYAQGFSAIENGFVKYVGTLNQATSASDKFYQASKYISDNMNVVIGLLGTATAAVVGYGLAFVALSVSLNPIGLAIATVAGLTAGFALLKDEIKVTENGLSTWGDVFDVLTEHLGNSIEGWKNDFIEFKKWLDDNISSDSKTAAKSVWDVGSKGQDLISSILYDISPLSLVDQLGKEAEQKYSLKPQDYALTQQTGSFGREAGVSLNTDVSGFGTQTSVFLSQGLQSANPMFDTEKYKVEQNRLAGQQRLLSEKEIQNQGAIEQGLVKTNRRYEERIQTLTDGSKYLTAYNDTLADSFNSLDEMAKKQYKDMYDWEKKLSAEKRKGIETEAAALSSRLEKAEADKKIRTELKQEQDNAANRISQYEDSLQNVKIKVKALQDELALKPIKVNVELDESKFKNVNQYNSLIEEKGKQYGVNPKLVQSIIGRESAGNRLIEAPYKDGKPQGQGLAQFTPDTQKTYGITDWRNATQQVDAATRYMADALKKTGGDVEKAIILYHNGLYANVNKVIQSPDKFPATTKYVKDVIGDYGKVSSQNELQEKLNKLLQDQAKIEQAIATYKGAATKENRQAIDDSIRNASLSEKELVKAKELEEVRNRQAVKEAERQLRYQTVRTQFSGRDEREDAKITLNKQIQDSLTAKGAGAIPEFTVQRKQAESEIQNIDLILAGYKERIDYEKDLIAKGDTQYNHQTAMLELQLLINQELDKQNILKDKSATLTQVEMQKTRDYADATRVFNDKYQQTQDKLFSFDGGRKSELNAEYRKQGVTGKDDKVKIAAKYDDMKMFEGLTQAKDSAVSSITSGFTNMFSDVLTKGKSFTDSFRDMFKNMISNISSGLMNLAMNSLMSGNFIVAGLAAAGSILVSLLGTLFKDTIQDFTSVASSEKGTVLGKPNESSNSIQNVIKTLNEIHANEYPELKATADAMRSLGGSVNSMVTKLAISTGSFTNMANAGTYTRPDQPAAKNPGGSMGMQAAGVVGSAALGAVTSGGVAGMAVGAMTGMSATAAAGGIGMAAGGGIGSGAVALGGAMIGAVGGLVIAGLVYGLGKLLGIGKTKITQLGEGMVVSFSDFFGQGMEQAMNAQSWAKWELKTTGWFSDSKKIVESYGSLSTELTGSLLGVFTSLRNVISTSVAGLGLTNLLKNKMEGYTPSTLRLDWQAAKAKNQNLDIGQYISDQINAYTDRIATDIFGNLLGQFQKMGEGMLETIVRLEGQVAVVVGGFNKLGINLSDKFGTNGMGAIEFSDALITLYDSTGDAKDGIKNFTSAIQAFYDVTTSAGDQVGEAYSNLDKALANIAKSGVDLKGYTAASITGTGLKDIAGQATAKEVETSLAVAEITSLREVVGTYNAPKSNAGDFTTDNRFMATWNPRVANKDIETAKSSDFSQGDWATITALKDNPLWKELYNNAIANDKLAADAKTAGGDKYKSVEELDKAAKPLKEANVQAAAVVETVLGTANDYKVISENRKKVLDTELQLMQPRTTLRQQSVYETQKDLGYFDDKTKRYEGSAFNTGVDIRTVSQFALSDDTKTLYSEFANNVSQYTDIIGENAVKYIESLKDVDGQYKITTMGLELQNRVQQDVTKATEAHTKSLYNQTQVLTTPKKWVGQDYVETTDVKTGESTFAFVDKFENMEARLTTAYEKRQQTFDKELVEMTKLHGVDSQYVQDLKDEYANKETAAFLQAKQTAELANATIGMNASQKAAFDLSEQLKQLENDLGGAATEVTTIVKDSDKKLKADNLTVKTKELNDQLASVQATPAVKGMLDLNKSIYDMEQTSNLTTDGMKEVEAGLRAIYVAGTKVKFDDAFDAASLELFNVTATESQKVSSELGVKIKSISKEFRDGTEKGNIYADTLTDLARKTSEANKNLKVFTGLVDATSYLKDFGQSIKDWVNNLRSTQLGSTKSQLDVSAGLFNQKITASKNPFLTADEKRNELSGITGMADTYIAAIKNYYGASKEGIDLIDQVVKSVSEIPDQLDVQELQLNAIRDLLDVTQTTQDIISGLNIVGLDESTPLYKKLTEVVDIYKDDKSKAPDTDKIIKDLGVEIKDVIYDQLKEVINKFKAADALTIDSKSTVSKLGVDEKNPVYNVLKEAVDKFSTVTAERPESAMGKLAQSTYLNNLERIITGLVNVKDESESIQTPAIDMATSTLATASSVYRGSTFTDEERAVLIYDLDNGLKAVGSLVGMFKALPSPTDVDLAALGEGAKNYAGMLETLTEGISDKNFSILLDSTLTTLSEALTSVNVSLPEAAKVLNGFDTVLKSWAAIKLVSDPVDLKNMNTEFSDYAAAYVLSFNLSIQNVVKSYTVTDAQKTAALTDFSAAAVISLNKIVLAAKGLTVSETTLATARTAYGEAVYNAVGVIVAEVKKLVPPRMDEQVYTKEVTRIYNDAIATVKNLNPVTMGKDDYDKEVTRIYTEAVATVKNLTAPTQITKDYTDAATAAFNKAVGQVKGLTLDPANPDEYKTEATRIFDDAIKNIKDLAAPTLDTSYYIDAVTALYEKGTTLIDSISIPGYVLTDADKAMGVSVKALLVTGIDEFDNLVIPEGTAASQAAYLTGKVNTVLQNTIDETDSLTFTADISGKNTLLDLKGNVVIDSVVTAVEDLVLPDTFGSTALTDFQTESAKKVKLIATSINDATFVKEDFLAKVFDGESGILTLTTAKFLSIASKVGEKGVSSTDTNAMAKSLIGSTTSVEGVITKVGAAGFISTVAAALGNEDLSSTQKLALVKSIYDGTQANIDKAKTAIGDATVDVTKPLASLLAGLENYYTGATALIKVGDATSISVGLTTLQNSLNQVLKDVAAEVAKLNVKPTEVVETATDKATKTPNVTGGISPFSPATNVASTGTTGSTSSVIATTDSVVNKKTFFEKFGKASLDLSDTAVASKLGGGGGFYLQTKVRELNPGGASLKYVSYDSSTKDISVFYTDSKGKGLNLHVPDANKFATGGVKAPSGIVTKPTAFDMGLWGEEGAEAIMPLTSIGGDLGVKVVMPKADGGSTVTLDSSGITSTIDKIQTVMIDPIYSELNTANTALVVDLAKAKNVIDKLDVTSGWNYIKTANSALIADLSTAETTLNGIRAKDEYIKLSDANKLLVEDLTSSKEKIDTLKLDANYADLISSHSDLVSDLDTAKGKIESLYLGDVYEGLDTKTQAMIADFVVAKGYLNNLSLSGTYEKLDTATKKIVDELKIPPVTAALPAAITGAIGDLLQSLFDSIDGISKAINGLFDGIAKSVSVIPSTGGSSTPATKPATSTSTSSTSASTTDADKTAKRAAYDNNTAIGSVMSLTDFENMTYDKPSDTLSGSAYDLKQGYGGAGNLDSIVAAHRYNVLIHPERFNYGNVREGDNVTWGRLDNELRGMFNKYKLTNVEPSSTDSIIATLAANGIDYKVGHEDKATGKVVYNSNGASDYYAQYADKEKRLFANGGAFTNGIVSTPTQFNMGLMGEAGSEAIMPLTNVNGKLGVYAANDSNTNRDEEIAELKVQNQNMQKQIQLMVAQNQILQAGFQAVIEENQVQNDSLRSIKQTSKEVAYG